MNARSGFWLGVCVALGVLAAPAPLIAQSAPPAAANPPVTSAPDLAFGRFIALIRGHLLEGDDLVKLRQWDTAYPHFNFPHEEIYGIIRDDLRGYKTPPFDGALRALARTVKARNAKQYTKDMDKVETALSAADAGLKAKVPDWPRFEVSVAMSVLKNAPDEYDDAIANGRVVHPVGYRTARGFILQAERMIESTAPDFDVDSAASLADIRAGFAQLKTVFSPANAPERPPIEQAAFLAVVAQIESASAKLLAAH